MKRLTIRLFTILLFLMAIFFPEVNANSKASLNILMFYNTAGYRHEAIPDALKAMYEIADEYKWNLESTEDSTFFTARNLEKFDVIVFLLTDGEVLDEEGKQALKDFIQSDRGFAVIHSGTATLQGWPWFMELLGAGFIGHPPVQEGRLVIEDKDHPSVRFIDKDTVYVTDEWYSFDRNPRPFVNVVMSIDESSYNVDDNRWFEDIDQRMGDHPVVWTRKINGSRIFQTALGHEADAYKSEFLRKHIAGGIQWTSGIEP